MSSLKQHNLVETGQRVKAQSGICSFFFAQKTQGIFQSTGEEGDSLNRPPESPLHWRSEAVLMDGNNP
jgi:hypothetical protein